MMEEGYDQTLSGLLRKRAELSGLIETLRQDWEAATTALNAIDAATRVFKPNLTVEDLPERPAAPPFIGGTPHLQRFLIDVLRRTDRPVRTSEMVSAVMTEREVHPTDRVILALIRKRCGKALGRLRLSGAVVGNRYGSGPELEWRLSHSNHMNA